MIKNKEKFNMSFKIKREIRELKVLLRSIPSPVVVLFAVSVITMNLLANKSLDVPIDWLALDCGILVSWVSFLSLDIITKHFGAKAATQISIVAVVANLITCGVFYIAGILPGMWGEAYIDGSEAMINAALNNTFSGTWYVLFGSTTAFIVSALVNNTLNALIGRMLRNNPNGFTAYALRTYISTAAGQFVDNLVFAFIVSHFFFGWSTIQCVTCSVTGMLAELICEVVFSPVGYAICTGWRKENVGRDYFEFRKVNCEDIK